MKDVFFYFYLAGVCFIRILCLINALEIPLCSEYSIPGFVLILFFISSWRAPDAYPYIGQNENRRFPRRSSPTCFIEMHNHTITATPPLSLSHQSARESPTHLPGNSVTVLVLSVKAAFVDSTSWLHRVKHKSYA